jgi:prophage regulatory protein
MVALLRLPAVLARTALSRSAMYALAQRGEFPKPVKVQRRASAWVEAEVDAWIAQRIAASRVSGS